MLEIMTDLQINPQGRSIAELADPDCPGFDLRHHFRKRILNYRRVASFQVQQPAPTAGHQRFLIVDEIGIETPFIEWPFDDDGNESLIDNVLRERRIAANVTVLGRVQYFRIEQANHVSQVKIAVGKLGNVFAAHFAQITFVALGHEVNCKRSSDCDRTIAEIDSEVLFAKEIQTKQAVDSCARGQRMSKDTQIRQRSSKRREP